MKVFKKYILPFLALYSILAIVVAGIVYGMTINGYAPLTLSDFQFLLTFLSSTLIAGVLGYLVMNSNKNIKAVYSNVSKQPLLVVCVGEGLFASNALIADLFDGVVLGALIVVFPLFLYVMKTMNDIKDALS